MPVFLLWAGRDGIIGTCGNPMSVDCTCRLASFLLFLMFFLEWMEHCSQDLGLKSVRVGLTISAFVQLFEEQDLHHRICMQIIPFVFASGCSLNPSCRGLKVAGFGIFAWNRGVQF